MARPSRAGKCPISRADLDEEQPEGSGDPAVTPKGGKAQRIPPDWRAAIKMAEYAPLFRPTPSLL
jgi:hypothetical protein